MSSENLHFDFNIELSGNVDALKSIFLLISLRRFNLFIWFQ